MLYYNFSKRDFMNIERLKHKNLLFVSDDLATVSQVKTSLDEVFFNIIYITNYTEVYERFFGEKRSDELIDLILYDVNKENFDVLKSIRATNDRIPIFTTSCDYNLINVNELLQLKIYSSFAKPIESDSLISSIYEAMRVVAKRKFSAYFHQTSIVTRTDLSGNMLYANDLFYETSGYSKEEIIGKPHSIIRNPTTSPEVYKKMWEQIESGNNWHGVLKNINKNKEPYYVNTTIFPIYDGNKKIKEYLSIKFLVTQEEEKMSKLKKYIMSQKKEQIENKKDFDSKVNQRVLEYAKKEQVKTQEIKQLVFDLEEELKKTRSDKAGLSQRSITLENDLKTIKIKKEEVLNTLKNKLREFMGLNYEQLKKIEVLEKKLFSSKEKIEKAQDGVIIFQGYIDEYRKKIEDLKDVIKLKEDELANRK